MLYLLFYRNSKHIILLAFFPPARCDDLSAVVRKIEERGAVYHLLGSTKGSMVAKDVVYLVLLITSHYP